MRRPDRKTVWTFAILAVSVLQLGTAGVVRFGRDEAKQALVTEQMRAMALQRQLALQADREAEAPKAADTAPRWHLPDGPDVAETLEVVNSLGVAARVTFDVIKAAPSTVVGKQTFLLSGRGTPPQVCEFLAAIEGLERLVIVESGRITPGGEEMLAFELALATYHVGGAR